jgi:hypothetical protein
MEHKLSKTLLCQFADQLVAAVRAAAEAAPEAALARANPVQTQG